MKPWAIVLSCEHASNVVPEQFEHAFSSAQARAALDSHQGVDFGALALAESLSVRLNAPLVAGSMSRLVVDLNRSEHHRHLFSKWSSALREEERAELLAEHRGYRHRVRRQISKSATNCTVLHLSVHSFTPVWHGKPRSTEIGLLYDPRRPAELAWAAFCRARLQQSTGLTIHRNAPYRGVSDGFTTALRREFSSASYLGIELEVNQRLIRTELPAAFGDQVAAAILGALDFCFPSKTSPK